MFKHILVPTDGSELSQKAVDAAVQLAATTGGTLTGYACLPEYPVSPFTEVIVEPPMDFHLRCERDAWRHLDKVSSLAASRGVRCNTRISTHASPYLGIIEAAEGEGCDVILMASHGRHGLARMLVGSETQRVLSHTRIPVLIYR
ncbi:universal stress protein UspA [Robbsia andropogonis]|uniref:Universal stress protein UspA n=1 Tax=Robbsia andropogonis TaxID=28092 RepID=A0A0F5JXM3_9BURK|nr:universal stress protein [Robbsia andropogonis]KKB62616.1 universal stress protein UspA [Robbsia andropogonis]MCP1117650.1 universal stress protein [Robbsia andropogonis]MCP1127116.1 universal stress protein [Robbsia andropogonis]